jgi:hypothetical protein
MKHKKEGGGKDGDDRPPSGRDSESDDDDEALKPSIGIDANHCEYIHTSYVLLLLLQTQNWSPVTSIASRRRCNCASVNAVFTIDIIS